MEAINSTWEANKVMEYRLRVWYDTATRINVKKDEPTKACGTVFDNTAG